jgi:hypothetical protein
MFLSFLLKINIMPLYDLNLGVNGIITAESDQTLTENEILDMLSEDTVKKAFMAGEALTGDDLASLRKAVEGDLAGKGFKNFNWK